MYLLSDVLIVPCFIKIIHFAVEAFLKAMHGCGLNCTFNLLFHS